MPHHQSDDNVSTEPPYEINVNVDPVKIRYVPLPAPLPPSKTDPVSLTATEAKRVPCRRCLQDAQPGETLDLIEYDPFPPDSTSPYRGNGPIFVHAPKSQCEPFTADHLPERQLLRLLSLRAYDKRDMMVASEVIEGSALEQVAGKMLADEKTRYVFVHNAKPGCFAVALERA